MIPATARSAKKLLQAAVETLLSTGDLSTNVVGVAAMIHIVLLMLCLQTPADGIIPPALSHVLCCKWQSTWHA
jgi:hypothetical protein